MAVNLVECSGMLIEHRILEDKEAQAINSLATEHHKRLMQTPMDKEQAAVGLELIGNRVQGFQYGTSEVLVNRLATLAEQLASSQMNANTATQTTSFRTMGGPTIPK